MDDALPNPSDEEVNAEHESNPIAVYLIMTRTQATCSVSSPNETRIKEIYINAGVV